MKAKIFGNDERMAALWQLMLDDETKNEKEKSQATKFAKTPIFVAKMF